MTTLTSLITMCRNAIGDTSGSPIISDTQITYWIQHASPIYPNTSPPQHLRNLHHRNDRQYDLETDVLGVISVEYPPTKIHLST